MTPDDPRTNRDPRTRPAGPVWGRLLGQCLIVAALAVVLWAAMTS